MNNVNGDSGADMGVYRSMQRTLTALPYQADKCSGIAYP